MWHLARSSFDDVLTPSVAQSTFFRTLPETTRMTRINVIDPSELTDQHLIAEFRELPRVFALARALKPNEQISSYRLGTGHVRFFYNKTSWLSRRQEALIAECIKRKFNIKYRTPPRPIQGLDEDWTPTPEAIRTNLERLHDKVSGRPGFYRYYGEKVSTDFYLEEEPCVARPY